MVAVRLMLENTWQPPDGRRSARFNRRPIRSKLNALKAKSISKIQAIELEFLINVTKGKFLDIQTSKI
jgi:hypothetical protein